MPRWDRNAWAREISGSEVIPGLGVPANDHVCSRYYQSSRSQQRGFSLSLCLLAFIDFCESDVWV